jgi:hypothetical protein
VPGEVPTAESGDDATALPPAGTNNHTSSTNHVEKTFGREKPSANSLIVRMLAMEPRKVGKESDVLADRPKALCIYQSCNATPALSAPNLRTEAREQVAETSPEYADYTALQNCTTIGHLPHESRK